MILRRFMHRTKKDEGRAEEIDSHLAHEQDAHAARGLSHQEARRQAHLRFGNPRGTRERVWRDAPGARRPSPASRASFPSRGAISRPLKFLVTRSCLYRAR